MDERLLILVRHSAITVDPTLPAQEWHLSASGRQRAHTLAQQIADYQPAAVIASQETKAQETAEIIATALDLPQQTAADLHEHIRHTFIADPAEWDATIAAFFARPDELVLGTETAHQAQVRFRAAVATVLQEHPQGNLVVVTHGTVLTLFLWQCDPVLDPYATWKSLTLPCYFVLALPQKRVIRHGYL